MDDAPGPEARRPRAVAPATSQPASTTDLVHLLRQCARGDEAAFGRLYDEVSPRLFGLIRRVVRDPAQAEEVTQEVFLEIWQHSARFDEGRGSPLSWMLTIAHRRAVDRVRAAEASARREATYQDTHQDVDFDMTAELAQSSLEAQRVRRAMASLTSAQRGALELAYFGGYTHTEVAKLLDLPLGTAKTRIRDGLIRLRDTLGVGS
ncbi:MAG TPA: ECF RNA polymerase sigma factor SigK [Segeticoccus sp.]|nr:ECF RNA polymerase sigma factor SigK [Segeticoccus sp.]HET8600822.1 ECF RNA polymerase sigma factor SigK [Segeticoccus sp.]